MKKILVAVAVTLLASSAAFAASNISATKHNLSTSGSALGVISDASQICAFCHTPHNAVPNVPLWNRAASPSTFKLYTSSGSLTPAAKAASLSGTSISLLCLSCHDATVAELGTRVANKPGGAAINFSIGAGTAWTAGGANLGSDLTNDHPVGFSYTVAQTQDTTGLKATPANVKLFGAGNDQIECASCHLVHDNTIAPFLRVTNAASALCLSCHSK